MMMQAQPGTTPRAPRQGRRRPADPWPMDRQDKCWTKEEDAILSASWPDARLSARAIAQVLRRSEQSVQQRAGVLDLGPRPPRRSSGLLPAYDGVALTPRLEAAWHRILSGRPLSEVLAPGHGLMAAEVAALRRWSASV